MTDELGLRDEVGTGEDEGFSAPTHRLPDALRLGQVRLQVADLARSLEYYVHVLGLREHARESGSATLTAVDDDAPLVELVEKAGAARLQPHSRTGLYHFAILVPGRAALGRFLGHLARTGTRIGASDHHVSEAIYLNDPDGLGIEVYADRPRAAWRRTGGQLEMTTIPMDTSSVLAAAGGVPWAGMPAGTVMGHIHLHVPELEAASRFYHAALGFDRTVWSYPGALFLSAGGYHHHLGLNTWAGRNAPTSREDDARLLEWRVRLPRRDDARAVATRLGDAGFETTQAGGDWLVDDPWGTRLRVSGG